MKLKFFNYPLDKKLIPQKPITPRDHSRLLVYNRKTGQTRHEHFYDLVKYLKPTDCLVFNDTKVFPARLLGQKATGGRTEALLLNKQKGGQWEALVRGKRLKIGLKLRFLRGLEATLVKPLSAKTWLLKFNFSGPKFQTILNAIGQVPLPPYIQSSAVQNELKNQYQTVFAKVVGSAAAPTAGFHFTRALLAKIKKLGCQMEFVTLQVGLGTFNPVDTENIEDYKIHSEKIMATTKTLKHLIKAKQEGKRIIAVGTTAARAVETIFQKKVPSRARGFNGQTNLFIYPGYKFKFVDALITNFHLPKSSLLMLVAALVGRSTILRLYAQARRLKYRFFSFGDAMFLT